MEILGHKIHYNLYNKVQLNIDFKKEIFKQIYYKNLDFGLLHLKNGKIIGKWNYNI